MNEEYLNQELVGKACLCVAKAMVAYSDAGPKDMPEVSEYLTKAMHIMSDKLTPANQERFSEWLIKEVNRVREEIGVH